ncbi:MAG: hypothetical protein Q9202_003208 [Teloschistes flavicans]
MDSGHDTSSHPTNPEDPSNAPTTTALPTLPVLPSSPPPYLESASPCVELPVYDVSSNKPPAYDPEQQRGQPWTPARISRPHKILTIFMVALTVLLIVIPVLIVVVVVVKHNKN